jgi:hypothetical protein
MAVTRQLNVIATPRKDSIPPSVVLRSPPGLGFTTRSKSSFLRVADYPFLKPVGACTCLPGMRAGKS